MSILLCSYESLRCEGYGGRTPKNEESPDDTQRPKGLETVPVVRESDIRDHERITFSESCCICLEEYAAIDHLVVLRCRHGFHIECALMWLRRMRQCPVCKTSVSPPDVGELFRTAFDRTTPYIDAVKWISLGGEPDFKTREFRILMSPPQEIPEGRTVAEQDTSTAVQGRSTTRRCVIRSFEDIMRAKAIVVCIALFNCIWVLLLSAGIFIIPAFWEPNCNTFVRYYVLMQAIHLLLRITATVLSRAQRCRARCGLGAGLLAACSYGAFFIAWMALSVVWVLSSEAEEDCPRDNPTYYFFAVALLGMDGVLFITLLSTFSVIYLSSIFCRS